MSRPQRLSTNARPAGVLLLVLTLTILGGCAGSPTIQSPDRLGIPEQLKLDDVPFHGQRDYQCGPASLAMVLNASGVDADVDSLIPQVFLPEREGSVQPEMLATLRRYERVPFVIDGNFNALLREIANGHPVIVMQNLSLPAWPVWHYAVAIGYDLNARELILHSGMDAETRTSFATFDNTWARSERWAVVALPPGELPDSIGRHRALNAIADFQRATDPQTALPAWRTLAERWPELAMGWFGLGNAEHATGNPEAAADAFRQATEQDAGLAVAWLNLGLSLEALGDIDRARDALNQAAALPSKWRERARTALDELSSE
ncbi:PA2778 family cysteine peptidase [Aidingimonas lacisalsi]|uniref:PA2778 family cysteine peptidase n=1 Tax=Aidingimonas lacisalsi TaxID=2604086 RepID=UPI0011D1EE23|nr:PA2778 family cysteine peptidase [Aidingimonas lacisalsi]